MPNNIIMADAPSAKWNPHNLPSGYTEYEYVEATGTQYINTGYVPTADTEIVFKFMRTAVQSYNAEEFGVTPNPKFLMAGRYAAFGTATDKTSAQYDPDAVLGTLTVRYNKDGMFDLLGRKIIDNGTPTWVSGNEPVYLLCKNGAGTAANFAKEKLYYCSFSESGTKTMELIPAMRNSDSVLGLYDTVSGNFFTNDGTGDFIGGAHQ